MSSQLQPLLEWLHGDDPLEHDTVDRRLRLLLLDTLGCILAGRRAPEVGALESALSAIEPGPLRFAGGRGTSASGSAMLAATAACWDEACEGLASAHGRPGVASIAAALPLSAHASFGDALRSLSTGYEVGARAGEALRVRPGMHVDANWPALGAAAAAARALALGPAGAETAIDIAACQLPYSLYLPVRAGATARNTYLGHAATLGMQAAIAASAGVSAPPDALLDYARHALTRDRVALAPPGDYRVLAGYLKPYAAVRHVHYGAAAAALLRDAVAPGGDTAGIARIVLRIYEEATVYCGNRAPATAIQAQFSCSFGVAAMLRFGSLSPDAYRADRFADGELRRLEGLVEIEVDPALTAAGRRGARLQIAGRSGSRACAVSTIKGDPEDPMTEADCEDKFVACAGASIGEREARTAARRLLAAGAADRLGEVLEGLHAAG